MSILLTVGIAHRDAPLAELERVAVAPADRANLRARAVAAGCAEVLLLSTCSRTELHTVLDVASPEDSDDQDAVRSACGPLADRLIRLLGPGTESAGRATVAIGEDAVRHVFRVAAGLDSRIVGEVEVQAQLRAATRAAVAVQGEPHRLRRLVAAACAAARATAAAEPGLLRPGLLAERAVTRALAARPRGREAREALVVGAGTMGRQLVAALTAAGCRPTLLSRTSSITATDGPIVHPLEELPSRLAASDVLFVATSAGRQILPGALVQDVVERRGEQPLTIVDLSLPRNVDRAVAHFDGVRLLDLDDLADRASATPPDAERLDTVEGATAAAAEVYCAEIRSRRAGPVIHALRERVEEACLEQIHRTTRGLGLPEEALVRMASAAAGAVAHGPTLLARQAAADGDVTTLATLAAAFRLDGADGQDPRARAASR